VVVHGLNRPHNVALISIDVPAVRAWAAKAGIADTEPAALAAHAQVNRLIASEIERLSDGLKPYEKVRGIVLVGDEFTPLNDLLTPSLKIKRRVVMKKWGDRIEALYAAPDAQTATASA
jgi:long-chain acyl-CoA synthetase